MDTKTLITAEEFAQMHTAEREDYELVDGELIPLPSARPRHNKVRYRLHRRIDDYFEQNPIGETFDEVDCRVAEDGVRRPDLSIFLTGGAGRVDEMQIPVPFAPDIAVEVLSPSEAAVDVNRKIRDYLDGGGQEVWILDCENGEVFVHTRLAIRKLAGDAVLDSPLLPGFAVPVNQALSR
jgi:Uma2 family endonuclease